MSIRRSLSYVALVLATCGVACAVGTTGDGSGGTGSGGDDAGTTDDSGGGGSDAGGGGFDAGGGGDDAGGGVDSGGTGDGGGGTDGGGGISCAVTNTCLSGRAIGSVSGDTGADNASGNGTTSEWLTVRVTENNSSIIGQKLKAKVTLTSPPGTNFDLYLYVNAGTDTQECTTVSAQSTLTGTSDSASLTWGEGSVANNSDDSRTVSIEVRNVSGTCAANSQWAVQVQGNQ